MSPAGLEHVVLGDSSISLVDGEAGGLSYRGFPIADLVQRASYEAVVHLLWRGDPPTREETRALEQRLAERRSLAPEAWELASHLPRGLSPLEGLRTVLSAVGDRSFPHPPTEAQGLALLAGMPLWLAAVVRARTGGGPPEPRAGLGHVANYLWMLTGRVPEASRTRALEGYFILLADHGMNASTFALRVVLSTDSDLVSAVGAAIGALKGPAHGGAPARVTAMLDAIGTPGAARGWVRAALDRKERLFGFGHRAYKVEDPRSDLLKRIARETADPDRFALAEAVEAAALEALREARPGRRLFTNVEFYGAVVLEAAGLPPELFTPTFAVARTAGWVAHAIEQARSNRLIRPEVRYVGPPVGRRWPV